MLVARVLMARERSGSAGELEPRSNGRDVHSSPCLGAWRVPGNLPKYDEPRCLAQAAVEGSCCSRESFSLGSSCCSPVGVPTPLTARAAHPGTSAWSASRGMHLALEPSAVQWAHA